MNFLGVVREQLQEAASLHREVSAREEIVGLVSAWGKIAADALSRGGTVFFAGNGGSFADAQHMAAELTGKMGRPRKPLSAVVLGSNSSSLSAVGNDYGFDNVFARELEALACPNSVVIAFSTSGKSGNILALAKSAEKIGIPMLTMTGDDGNEVGAFCETLKVPSLRTERIQEIHTLLGHTLCLVIEEELGLCEGSYNNLS